MICHTIETGTAVVIALPTFVVISLLTSIAGGLLTEPHSRDRRFPNRPETFGQGLGGVRRPAPNIEHDYRPPTGAAPTLASGSTSTTEAIFPRCSACSGVVVANRCIPRATIPVQPVWWLAPRPAPLSP